MIEYPQPTDMLRTHIFTSMRGPNPLEETTQRVIGAIKARLLSPGDRLPAERDLALQLGVSRSTLRVVLQNLIDDGWLEVRRGRNGGSFVARWPEDPNASRLDELRTRFGDDLCSLLDYRRAVESMSAACAAERATREELHVMQQLQEENAHLTANDLDLFRAYDTRLHAAIAYAAHSPYLMEGVTEVQTMLSDVLDAVVFYTSDQLGEMVQQHQRIIDAISNHETERALREMTDHVLLTEQRVYSLLSETIDCVAVEL